MSYEIIGHTADLRMKVSGNSPEELFDSAVKGMMAVLKKEKPAKGRVVRRQVKVNSINLTALLVDFLNEVLSLTEIHKEIYTKARFKKLEGKSILAELEGVAQESFDEDIKAVTYHEAQVKKNEKGEWETTLVFDI